MACRWERIVADKLIQVNNVEKKQKKQLGMPDTSQRMDWDNFRNESMDGVPYDLNDELPYEGVLTMDFVSTSVVHSPPTTQPLPDHAFLAMLQRLQLKPYGDDRGRLLQHFALESVEESCCVLPKELCRLLFSRSLLFRR